MAEQERYTLHDLAEMFHLSYSKVRYAVDALANIQIIKTRQGPTDNRILEVHKDSIFLIRQAATDASE
jgi:DNA-binding MarR family transcriptional regulator